MSFDYSGVGWWARSSDAGAVRRDLVTRSRPLRFDS